VVEERFITVERLRYDDCCSRPEASTRWHRDPFNRVTVALDGDALALEFCDGRPNGAYQRHTGTGRLGRAKRPNASPIKTGDVSYEEITVFFLTQADDVPQPDAS
jgi:hypothetical protein